MFALSVIFLFFTLVARRAFAQSDARRPIEFDLAFPRNETYAPTQYLPIVLAVRNASAVWPHGFSISFTVFGPNSEGGQTFNIPAKESTSGLPPTPGLWFAINGTNLTNNTEGSFSVVWSVRLQKACTDKETGKEAQTWGPFNVHFSTRRGAPLPDIEDAMTRCPANPLVVTPDHYNDGDCPVFAANATTPALADPCGLKTSAKEMAANVSTAILGLMGCSSGDWRNISQPCAPPEKENEGSRWIASLGIVFVLSLPTALMFLW